MTGLTTVMRHAADAVGVLAVIAHRLETDGAIVELHQFHHLSTDELDLLILQEISTGRRRPRPRLQQASSPWATAPRSAA